MNKLIGGFCVCFFLLSMLSGFMDGGGGSYASTKLTAVALEDDDTFDVASTTGFLSTGGVLTVGNEKVEYTATVVGQFTGIERGIEGTTASAHPIGTAVYHEDAGMLNYMFNFNVVETNIEGGQASVAATTWDFLGKALPRIISWNFAFLQGDFIILRDVLMAMSIGFLIYMCFQAISTIFGVLRP